MKKFLCLLSCLLLLASCVTCFAEEEGTSQQTYANEAIIVSDGSTVSWAATAAQTAEPVLRDVSYDTQGGRQLIVKLYEVAPAYDVKKLAALTFEDDGLIYAHKDTIKVSDNLTRSTKQVSQTVTVKHEKEDGAMASLLPMLEYSQDGYTGQLMLKTDSITTTETGKESYGYTVSDTREYPNLDRNDTAYVPKTVEKNGVSLELTGVDWQAMGNGSFTATATYAGRATGSKVTGYTSQAIYTGEMSKETLDSRTYKVVYEGKPMPVPYLQYGIAAGAALLTVLLASLLWHKRKNAKVYALLDGDFRVVRRVRISYIDPIVDLSPAAVQSRSSEYIITIDRWATKRLNNQRLRILCADGTVREQTIINTGYGYKIHLEAMPVPEPPRGGYEEDGYEDA